MAAARAGVLVVGSVNVDHVVRVERLPRAGETVSGGQLARFGGGKGANAAVAAARFGATVTFIGAVGDDELGRNALADLEAEGLRVAHALVVPALATGVALIVVDDAGENQIAVAPGANAALDGVAVEEELAALDVAERELLAGGVVLANLEIADEAVLAAGAFARHNGMRFVLNVAPPRPLPPALLALDPLIVANETEAAALPEVLAAVSAAIVTRG
ncbi:MAG TPA: PfkB family carbohydrate kinase, partial [Candidatus Limnocylindrales bacterium]